MIEFNSNRPSSKWRLSILALFGALTLSACQTTTPPPVSSTPMPTTVPTPTTIPKETVIVATESQNETTTPQADSIDNNYPVDGEYNESFPTDDTFGQNNDTQETSTYPIEPYTSPNQAPIAQSTTTISIPDVSVVEPAHDTQDQQIAEPTIEPYDPEYNKPNANTAPKNTNSSSMPAMPSHSELLERARQNSQQQTRQSSADNSSLPAFRNLMNVGINQLKSGQLTAAENSFTRAQRMAPKSSAVYFYLAQVALKKGQPRKAEAMARRGLVVSEDSNRRRALWQIILQSGQAQNSTRIIDEAKQALH